MISTESRCSIERCILFPREREKPILFPIPAVREQNGNRNHSRFSTGTGTGMKITENLERERERE